MITFTSTQTEAYANNLPISVLDPIGTISMVLYKICITSCMSRSPLEGELLINAVFWHLIYS